MFQITSLGLFLPFSLLPSRSSTTKWGIRSLCEQSCRFFPGQVYLVSLGSLCSLLQTTASLMIGSFSQSFWPTLRCHFCVFACLLSLFSGWFHESGQVIATLHDLTPNGGLVREFPWFQGNLVWWTIIIWPDECLMHVVSVVRPGSAISTRTSGGGTLQEMRIRCPRRKTATWRFFDSELRGFEKSRQISALFSYTFLLKKKMPQKF